MHLIRTRTVPVEFVDLPSNMIDRSLFHPVHYPTIERSGFQISPLKIVHNATIHYQTRFRRSNAARFLNALLDTIKSFAPMMDKHLHLDDSEGSELQMRSSEVIATGLSVGLASRLFDINKNLINVIESSTKRCDFRFEKNGLEYVLESKGRKGSVRPAISDILLKKAAHGAMQPKYGFISRVPRNGVPTSMIVVDPEYFPHEISSENRAIYLLIHYSKKARLSGFWRLADLLDERKIRLQNGASLEEIDQRPLEYGSVIKFGTSVEINAPFTTFRAFIANNRADIGSRLAGYSPLIAGLDERIIELLERQDYRSLFSFKSPDMSLFRNHFFFSINSDGSIMMLDEAIARRVTLHDQQIV